MLRKLIAILFVVLFFSSNTFAAAPDLRQFYPDYVTHKEYQGDFNGDGIPDLFLEIKRKLILIPLDDISIPVPTLTTYATMLANADGTYTAIHQQWDDKNLGINWQSVKQVLIGDFNFDNRADILLVGPTTYLLHADTSSNFSAITQQWNDGYLGINWSQASSASVSDVNGDGRADVTLVFPDKTVSAIADVGGQFTTTSGTYTSLHRRTGTVVVGQSGGAFAVGPNGAATYSLPIVVPPGMAGMQPSLSINYNSHAGNGILGVGWSLNGGSVIQRCPQTWAQDGNHSGVHFDTNDRLCLDGQRLVAVSGNYGVKGTQYRTEKDTFSLITQSGGDIDSGKAVFTVQTKAGQTLEYGTANTNSRFVLNGHTPVFLWAVKKMQDAVGNTVNVNYTMDSSIGSQYISSMTYTSLNNGNAEVRFNYEDRPDATNGYVLGSKLTSNKRLASVETYVDNNFVRSVELYYEQSPGTARSRVIKLQDCSYDGTCLAPTRFSWDQRGKTWPDIEVETKLCANDNYSANSNCGYDYRGSIQYADINGDGKADMCYRDQSGIRCYPGTETGFNIGGVIVTDICAAGSTKYGGCRTMMSYDTLRFVDINADGKADIIYRGDDGFQYHLSTGSGFNYQVSTGILPIPKTCQPDYYGEELCSELEASYYAIQYPDINADGLPEICFRTNANGVSCYLGTTSGFQAGNITNTGICASAYNGCDGDNNYKTIQFADINGDGLQDLVYRSDFGVRYRLYSSDGFGPRNSTNICADGSGAYGGCNDGDNHYSIQYADVTGDGNLDMCFRSDEGIRCIAGTGAGFDTSKQIITSYCSNVDSNCNDSDNHPTIRFADINADGKADLIYRGDATGLRYLLSTGTGFGTPVDTGICTNAGSYGCNDPSDNFLFTQLMDSNGDGILDVAIRSDDGVRVFLSQGGQHDILASVSDGLGNETHVTYSTLNDPSVYMGPGVCVNGYQERCIEQLPMPVVKSYTASNGVGGTNSYEYQYGDLRIHLRGRGMLGFGYVWKKDVVNNTSTRTWYDNSTAIQTVDTYPDTYPYLGMPTMVQQIAPNDTVVSETTNTFDKGMIASSDNTTSPAIFPYFATSTEVTRDPSNFKVSTTTSTNTYDTTDIQYGDITNIVVETVDHVNVATFTKTVTNDYYPVSGWKLGRLSSTSVTHAAFGKTETRNSSFTYNANGLLETSIEEPGDPNLMVTTSYSYDSFGNKSAVTVEGGMPGSTYYVAPRTTTTDLITGGTNAQIVTTNALGHSETKYIDTRDGNVTSLTGPNGLTTTWEYDGFGRKLKEKRADGNSTTISQNFCSGCAPVEGITPSYYVTSQSSGSSPKTVYYDQLGRKLRSVSQDVSGKLVYTDTLYNNKGQITQVSAPYFSDGSAIWKYYTYDDYGRVKKKTDPSGTIKTNTYGALLTQTEVERKSTLNIGTSRYPTTIKRYYANGKVREITDANGGITNFYYDAVGNLTKTLAPGEVAGSTQIATEMSYDKKGRKTVMVDPDMGTWTYHYDATGQLRQQVDAKGNVIDMLYDSLGRMIVRLEYEVDSGTYYANSWEYYQTIATGSASMGKLFRVTGPIAISQAQRDAILISNNPVNDVLVLKTSATYQRAYVYDEFGRPGNVTTTIDGTDYQVDTAYDSLSRVSQITYPQNVQNNRLSVEYLYSNTGYLLQVRNANAQHTTYWCLGGGTSCSSGAIDTTGAYNARGQLEMFGYGNNLVTYRTHNANTGLVNDIVSSNPWVQNAHYVFDSIGNLEQRSDENSASFDGTGKFRETFSYDNLNRLTTMTLYGKIATSGQITTELQYYANGNIKYRTGLGFYQYNPSNGIRPHGVNDITSDAAGTTSVLAGAYNYDANGNMTSGNNRGMSYTAYNKPYGIVRVGSDGTPKTYFFEYGADHSRYHQDTPDKTIDYIRGSAQFEREVMKSTGEVKDVHYITAGNLIVGTYVIKADQSYMRYYHYDHLGSIAVITDDVANVVERLNYDAFGQRRDADFWTPSTTQIVAQQTNYGFTGHEHIDQVGLIHMNGRVYDPMIGRFISADPNIQAPQNSQSYNRYSYVLNNPLSMTDPTGYFSWGLFDSVMDGVGKAFPYIYTAIAIYAGYQLGGVVSTAYGGTTSAMVAGGAVGGATVGFFASRGDWGATLQGALTGGMFGYVGATFQDTLSATMAHGVVGGISAEMQGGKFLNGFVAQAFSKLVTIATRVPNLKATPGRFITAAIVGGVSSQLGGGKFANGAWTAAMGYLFNEASSHHSKYRPILRKDLLSRKQLSEYGAGFGEGAWSVARGVGNSFRFVGRGLGVYGDDEYSKWKMEGLAVDEVAILYVNHEAFRYFVNQEVKFEFNNINWTSRSVGYVAGRLVTGVLLAPAGALAAIGDMTRAVENKANTVRAYMNSIIFGDSNAR